MMGDMLKLFTYRRAELEEKVADQTAENNQLEIQIMDYRARAQALKEMS